MQNIILGHGTENNEKEEAFYTDDVMQPLKICTQETFFPFFFFYMLLSFFESCFLHSSWYETLNWLSLR